MSSDVDQVIVGAFWTAVLSDSLPPKCGIASSMREYDHQEGPQVESAGFLEKKNVVELANLLKSSNVMEASIGMAAVNASIKVNEKYCKMINARDLILEKSKKQNVVVVGHFPFANQIRSKANKCWILELRPRKGDLPAWEAKNVIPQAEVVAISGTTLINHTFDKIMRLCNEDAYVILLGGSVPLVSALFDLGVNALAGTIITKPLDAIRTIAQGGTFRQIPGRKLLTLMNHQ
jgi:uncharacterized protein (DUF4213/DUF364 family)